MACSSPRGEARVVQDGEFQSPTDITLDAAGSIYVTDGLNHRVQKFRAPAPAHHEPTIVSVRDVRDDEGGEVFVRWTPSDLDAPGIRSITGYRLWRRLPPDVAARLASKASAVASTWNTDGMIVCGRIDPASATGVSFWEAIVTMPAEQLEGYGVGASTRQDSTRRSNPYTAFFVSAITNDPFVFYQSAIDSGYSVDNRATRPPAIGDDPPIEFGEPDFLERELRGRPGGLSRLSWEQFQLRSFGRVFGRRAEGYDVQRSRICNTGILCRVRDRRARQ